MQKRQGPGHVVVALSGEAEGDRWEDSEFRPVFGAHHAMTMNCSIRSEASVSSASLEIKRLTKNIVLLFGGFWAGVAVQGRVGILILEVQSLECSSDTD